METLACPVDARQIHESTAPSTEYPAASAQETLRRRSGEIGEKRERFWRDAAAEKGFERSAGRRALSFVARSEFVIGLQLEATYRDQGERITSKPPTITSSPRETPGRARSLLVGAPPGAP